MDIEYKLYPEIHHHNTMTMKQYAWGLDNGKRIPCYLRHSNDVSGPLRILVGLKDKGVEIRYCPHAKAYRAYKDGEPCIK